MTRDEWLTKECRYIANLCDVLVYLAGPDVFEQAKGYLKFGIPAPRTPVTTHFEMRLIGAPPKE